MKFEPLVVLWLLWPLCGVTFGLVGWQLYRAYRKQKVLSVPWIRRAVVVVLVLCIGLGPSVAGATSSPGVRNLDVLFVVDTTASMGALDYNGTALRMAGVKNDLRAISSALSGAYMGLVTFDSKANTVIPFNPDQVVFNAGIDSIEREIYGTSKGSAIDKPLDVATQQLKDRKAAEPERSRLFFYLGDGEKTSSADTKSFSALAEYVDGGAVLGYGTKDGAKMSKFTGIEDTKASDSYILTPDQSTKALVPAVSKIDEPALRKIASEVKIQYANRNSGGPVDGLLDTSKAKLLIDKGRKVKHYFNLYWVFAIPLTVLLFWEWKILIILSLDLQKVKGKKHAKPTV